MPSATLNLKVIPRRMLSLSEAAAYCGLSAKRFPVHCGVLPVEMPDGKNLYDMHDLDAWIENLKPSESNNDDELLGRLG